MEEKARKQLILLFALLFIFLLVLINSLSKVMQRGKQAKPPAAAALPMAAHHAAPAGVKKDDAGWVRCPFSGKVYSPSAGSGKIDLKLTGIVWDEQRPQALVNNLILREGSSIGRFKVIKIFKDKVSFSSDGATFDLRLEQ